MNREVSNEVRVKDEPIFDSQSISETREEAILSNNQPNKLANKEQSIKHEKQFIVPKCKMNNREDISSHDEEQPNKRKRTSIKVKNEPIETDTEEFVSKTSIAFLNEEETTTKTTNNNPIKNTNQVTTINSNKCNVCNRSFSKSTYLRYHQRVHTGERPYKCETCQKRFTSSSNLLSHRRIHTGEKPYECEICHKSFSQLSSFVDHRRIHTGEKPYECSICKKRFINASHLTRHKRIHNRDRP